MIQDLKLRKVGNSVGVILPKEVLAHLKADEGEVLQATEAADGSLRLQKSRPEVSKQMKVAQDIMDRYRNTAGAGEMSDPVWVLKETVLGLHEQSLHQHGGASGMRDEIPKGQRFNGDQ